MLLSLIIIFDNSIIINIFIGSFLSIKIKNYKIIKEFINVNIVSYINIILHFKYAYLYIFLLHYYLLNIIISTIT